jgi:hypothetical protein
VIKGAKMKKTKGGFWKEIKVSENKVCLFFTKKKRFFSNTAFGGLANSHFCSKKFQIFFKRIKICIPMGEHI